MLYSLRLIIVREVSLSPLPPPQNRLVLFGDAAGQLVLAAPLFSPPLFSHRRASSESESVAVDLVGGAAVLLDVLVTAVLVREAPEERLARQAPGDVANTVFAFSAAGGRPGRPVCNDNREKADFREGMNFQRHAKLF